MAKHYYTVWAVDFENDNRAKVSLSRSRKVRDNDYDKSLENAGKKCDILYKELLRILRIN